MHWRSWKLKRSDNFCWYTWKKIEKNAWPPLIESSSRKKSENKDKNKRGIKRSFTWLTMKRWLLTVQAHPKIQVIWTLLYHLRIGQFAELLATQFVATFFLLISVKFWTALSFWPGCNHDHSRNSTEFGPRLKASLLMVRVFDKRGINTAKPLPLLNKLHFVPQRIILMSFIRTANCYLVWYEKIK